MRLTIFGSGYVGLGSGACMAEMGNHVVCVDFDEARISRLYPADVVHSRVLKFGQIEFGLGIERTDDGFSGEAGNDGRAFQQWRSSY